MESPGQCCLLALAHLPGLLTWTDPPLVVRRALAFVSTKHRPSRSPPRGRRGGRCRCTDTVPVTRDRLRLSPIHADPVARAIKSWCQSEPSSLSPVGVAPDPPALDHCSVASARSEDRPQTRSASPTRPVSRTTQQAPVSAGHPEGAQRLGLTPHLERSPASGADSPCPAFRPKAQCGPVEVAVNSVLCSGSAAPRRRCGFGPKPHSSPPRWACALRNRSH